jgi:hypothetical protein
MYQCTNVPLGKFIFAKMGLSKREYNFYYILYILLYYNNIYNKPI